MLAGSVDSNSSFMFVALLKTFQLWEISLHSVNICFTVYGFPQEHFGGGSCFLYIGVGQLTEVCA